MLGGPVQLLLLRMRTYGPVYESTMAVFVVQRFVLAQR